jgi:hypothetical protein
LIVLSGFSSQSVAQEFEKAPTLRVISPFGVRHDDFSFDKNENLLYVAFGQRILAYNLTNGGLVYEFKKICSDRILKIKVTSVLFVECLIDSHNKEVFILNKSNGEIIKELDGCHGNDSYYHTVEMTLSGNIRICGGRIFDAENNYFNLPSRGQVPIALSHDEEIAIYEYNGIIGIVNTNDLKLENEIRISNYNFSYNNNIEMSRNKFAIAYFQEKNLYLYNLKNLSNSVTFSTRLESAKVFFGDDNDTVFLHSQSENRTEIYRMSEKRKVGEVKGEILDVTSDGIFAIVYRSNGFHILGDASTNFWLQNQSKIVVNTNVKNFEIKIDGEPQTLVNGELKLFPGTYMANLSTYAHHPESLIFDVKPNQVATLNINFKKILSSIEINSNPSGADVFFDGKNIGKTPLRVNNLEFGAYRYSLVLEGYKEEFREVIINSENFLKIELKLSEISSLTFSSNPQGATVKIDGKVIGQTPFILTNATVKRLQFEVVLQGHATYFGITYFPSAGRQTIQVNLNPMTSIEIQRVEQASELAFNREFLEEANQSLFLINSVPMLPIISAAKLIGAAVLGDAVNPKIVHNDKEINFFLGEPTLRNPTAYYFKNTIYIPITSLKPLGVKLASGENLILDLNGDRILLEKRNKQVYTNILIDPVRILWKEAIESSILVDKKPAFLINDLIKINKKISYDYAKNVLFLEKMSIKAFEVPKGFKVSLVFYKNMPYLPIELLSLIGTDTQLSKDLIQIKEKGIEFELKFSSLGRPNLNSRDLLSNFKKLQQIQLATLNEILKTTKSTYLTLNLTLFGMINSTAIKDGKQFVFINIISASNTNRNTWKSCTWQSSTNSKLESYKRIQNGFIVSIRSQVGLTVSRIEFKNSTRCQVTLEPVLNSL